MKRRPPDRSVWTMLLLFTLMGPAACRMEETPDQISRNLLADGPCQDCITLERVALLGDVGDNPGYLQESQWVARDGRGQIWVLQWPFGAKVFGQDGTFLAEVGSEGAGPGEFREPNWIYVTRDGLIHIVDRANARETVFSPDMLMVDERPLPGGIRRVEVLSSGQRVANMSFTGPDGQTLPLHILHNSEVVTSFGEPITGPDSRGTYRVTVSSDGTIYTIPYQEYEIDLWDTSGRHMARLERPGFWEAPDRGEPPWILITGIHADSRGRLWVITWVPKGEPLTPPNAASGEYRTQVEVIDVQRRQVLAQAEFDELIMGFLDDSLVHGPSYTRRGEPQIHVSRLEYADP